MVAQYDGAEASALVPPAQVAQPEAFESIFAQNQGTQDLLSDLWDNVAVSGSDINLGTWAT